MKRGFTLVELIVTICLIAAVALLIIPNVTNSINNATNKSQKNQEKMIINSAEKYVTNNAITDEQNFCIKINTLKQKGYLKNKDLVNVNNGDSLNDYYVIVEYLNNQYNYKIDKICGFDLIY